MLTGNGARGMKLSVIIVSYNVEHYLRQCLDSLRRAVDGIDAEICVVDNHSKDGTVNFLNSLDGTVKVVASNHNYGFARANNIGIRQTSGEYVLLLNPDTVVGESTIKDCLAFMDAHSSAGGLGVQMLKSDGGKAMESRRGLPTPMVAFYKMCGLCTRFPHSKRFGRYYMCGMDWDKPGKIEVISGAFLMARRTAFEKAGLLDEDFFMYGEDIDLSYRFLKSGFENWYLPVKILHYKGESTHKSSFRYVHVFYEAMLIFFQKHYSHLGFWLYIPIRTAIYFSAIVALVKMASANIKKMLGFPLRKRAKRPFFVFLGSARSIEQCRAIAYKTGMEASYFVCDEKSNVEGHSVLDLPKTSSPVYVVYDISSYKYETVLDIFSSNSRSNVFVGIFNPADNIIITDKEIIS